MSSRYNNRNAIRTELEKNGLMFLINFHSWNQPERYTELLIDNNIEQLPQWKKALEIMEKHAPSDDTKRALELCDDAEYCIEHGLL